LKSDNDRKEFNYSDKNLPHFPSVRHKPHKDGLGSNVDLQNDRAATNRYTKLPSQKLLSGALYHYRNIQAWNRRLAFF